MTTMQFKDFIFRHNPERISVGDSRRIVSHFCPGAAEITQNLGQNARAVTCAGCFFGDNFSEALAQLLEFRQKSDGETGMLYLPGLPPFPAKLVELAFEATGDGRVIPYTMRFLEAVEL